MCVGVPELDYDTLAIALKECITRDSDPPPPNHCMVKCLGLTPG